MDLDQLYKEVISAKNLMIIQDIDGVCIPLVKDPLKRTLNKRYIRAAAKLNGELHVLTNGEHEGRRGLNRLIERSCGGKEIAIKKGLYLPGLAAGGVELQDRYGSTSHPGVTKKELEFLANLPCRMKKLLELGLQRIFPDISYEIIKEYSQNAVLDTIYSPTINLNGIFTLTSDNIATKNMIQRMIEEIMLELISSSKELGLDGSFFLHIAPNLGSEDGREKLKLATINDVGTTDIQFMIKGAVKEAGVMVLLNQHIKKKYGEFPFGQDFNVKNAPYEIDLILELCKRSIPKERMPLLIGVGDTVTSTKSQEDYKQLRGGSDRGFLTLVQEIGKSYMIPNRVVLVDSSSGEVDRPTLKTKDLNGITDPNDPLKFDVLVKDGPEEYIKWFESFANTK